MKPVGITSFQGRSIYGKAPVVRLRVAAGEVPCLSAAVLRQRLADRLPEGEAWWRLRQSVAALCDGREEVDACDLLGLMTRDLQPTPFGDELPVWQQAFASRDEPEDQTDVLVGIWDPDVGERAALLACDVLRRLLADEGEVNPRQHRDALSRDMAAFRRHCLTAGYNESTRVLIDAARARGVPVRKLVRGQRFALFGHGARSLRVAQCASDRTSGFAGGMSNDKALTSRVLQRVGIPMPKQRLIESERDIEQAVAEIGFPLVVKAKSGSKGHSVTANIRSPAEIEPALAKARRFGSRQVIEQHVEGTDYRLLVVDGRMLAAARRRAAQVIGDGALNIQSLVEAANAARRARGGYACWLEPLALDADSIAFLARDGLTPESVPASGQIVRLRSAGNVSQGGVPEDVTELVHPDTAALAVRAARTVGLDIAGIDVLTTDITRPLAETGGVVIEVNQFPSLRPHYAIETPPRDVAGAIVDHLCPAPERGRIPLLAVTGTNGKTTTCRMLRRILTEAGYFTGLTSTAGAYVGDERVLKGDYANPVGAHAVLQDPRVEAAVLETPRGSLVKKGLGWDSCDVATVTNIREDHVGQDGILTLERMAEVKGMIVEHARRAVVLNADEDLCRGLAQRASAPVWWFSAKAPSPMVAAHLAAGGNAVVLEGEGQEARLVHHAGETRHELLRMLDLPAALDGLAQHNVENALAAAAAALAVGIPHDLVVDVLGRFSLSFEDSPGRLNIHDVDGARIVVDYAHNGDGIRRMGNLLKQMPVSGRRLCLIAVTQVFIEEEVNRLATALAPFFERFVVADSFRPAIDRPLGEVANVMRDCLEGAGVSSDAILVEPDEYKAMDLALGEVRSGDLLLILVGRRYEIVWEKVQALHLAETSSDSATRTAAVS